MRISILTCFPLLDGTIGGKHILCISIPSWEAFDLEIDDILEPSCSYGFVGSKSKDDWADARRHNKDSRRRGIPQTLTKPDGTI